MVAPPNGGRTTKWWFVIRGAEDVLIELQDKWENIALQTSWKLEDCFMFSDSVQVQAPQQHVEHPSTQDASPPFPAQQQPVIANNASPQQPNKSVTNEPQLMNDDPVNNGDSSNNDSPFLGQH